MPRPRSLDEVETAEATARYAIGSSLSSIARTLGKPESSVRAALLRAGVDLRRNGWPVKYDAALTVSVAQMRRLGYSWADVAEATSMTVGAARRAYERAAKGDSA